jgi:hypothetical protein
MFRFFRFSYIESFDKNSFSFVIENTNNVYHQIEQGIFSIDEVSLTIDFYGSINISNTRGEEIVKEKEYKGYIITLTLPDNQYYSGVIQLRGSDSLGNDFKVNSKALKFKDYKLTNHFYVSQTYFQKVPTS